MPDPDKPTAAPSREGAAALAREFLRELFDLQFGTFLTTRMLPAVFGLGILLAGLATTYFVFSGFRGGLGEGFVRLVLAPAVFLGLVTALRITLEFVLAVFRVAWYVEQVATHTEVVSQEIPRFGVLRTLLFGKAPKPPGPP